MPLTADEQELLNFGVGALPDWIAPNDPLLTAAAKTMGQARATGEYLFSQALITTATGATSTTPDWLNQHARDRGTSRQAGEGDAALQQRLRVVPDALTRSAILTAANSILAAAGVSGQAAMIELPRDAAWLGTYQPILQGDPGGAFAHLGSQMTFTPSTLGSGIGGMSAAPLWVDPGVFPGMRYSAHIAFAIDSANNGVFQILGLVGNAIVYNNPSGVNNAADTGALLTVYRMDALSNQTDGHARSFCNRGWRVATARPFTLILILPFGTDAGTQASITESIRLKKAAGFAVVVERRLHP